jgi:hypothetical protein
MPDETAPPLGVRRRWSCSRDQLREALEHLQDSGHLLDTSCDTYAIAAAILGRLPELGAGFTVTATSDLQAVLAAAFGLCPDVAAFNRCAEAAGLVSS